MSNEGLRRLLEALTDVVTTGWPKSPSEFLAQSRELNPDRPSVFERAVDQSHICEDCGGQNGLLVGVPKSGEVKGCVVVHLFKHDGRDSMPCVQFSAEDAKQLVNVLGEAIAAAEALAVR